MLMLAATCVVFFPLLASGSRVRSAASRIGLARRRRGGRRAPSSSGSACSSAAAAPRARSSPSAAAARRMLVTLLFFIVGSVDRHGARAVVGRASRRGDRSRLLTTFGAATALAISLAAFAAIAALTVWLERGDTARSIEATRTVRRRPGCAAHGRSLPARSAWRSSTSPRSLLAGRPWGVTSAFALWGAKGAAGDRHSRRRPGRTGRRRRRRRRSRRASSATSRR